MLFYPSIILCPLRVMLLKDRHFSGYEADEGKPTPISEEHLEPYP